LPARRIPGFSAGHFAGYFERFAPDFLNSGGAF
jgi:hypothetical protein